MRLSADVRRETLKRSPPPLQPCLQHCIVRVPRLPGESRIPNLTYAGLGVQPLLNLHGLPGPQNLLLPLGPQSLLGMGVALPGPGGGVRRSLCHREPCPTASRGCGHGPEDTRQETDRPGTERFHSELDNSHSCRASRVREPHTHPSAPRLSEPHTRLICYVRPPTKTNAHRAQSDNTPRT